MEPSEYAGANRDFGWVLWSFLGLGLGILACWLMWWGQEQLVKARSLAASTFDFPEREPGQAQLLFLAAGALFVTIVLLSRYREVGSSAAVIVGGALPPLALLLVMWDWLGPAL